MNLNLDGVRAGLLIIPAACAALGYVAVKVWRGMRRAVRLSDDILGTPTRPGVLTRLEGLTTTVDTLRKEVHPNHGTSLGEAVHEIRLMAEAAAQKAADAASEAEGLSGALAHFHHDSRARADVAGRERRGVQESLDALLRTLAEHAAEGYAAKAAVVDGFRQVGIDLGHIMTAELDATPVPPHTHHVETVTTEPDSAGDSDAR